MQPLYVFCPYCRFPVVIRGPERALPRHCRQCRSAYLPSDAINGSHPPEDDISIRKQRRRVKLRAVLQQSAPPRG